MYVANVQQISKDNGNTITPINSNHTKYETKPSPVEALSALRKSRILEAVTKDVPELVLKLQVKDLVTRDTIEELKTKHEKKKEMRVTGCG